MKMKIRLFLILTLLIISSLSILPVFAQYEPYTQLSLPEGAKARFGKGSVNEITYSPDGSILAVAGSLGIWLYDAETSEELALLAAEHRGGLSSVSFSPSGTTVAGGGAWPDSQVYLWDVATSTLKTTLTGHTGPVESVALQSGWQDPCKWGAR